MTPPEDSWAIDAASAVADALELSGKYEHVTFVFPEPDELTITVDVGTEIRPLVLGFTHGHVASSPDRMPDCWQKQALGRQKAGEADMLVSAHWHHLRLRAIGGNRTWLQIPALDGGQLGSAADGRGRPRWHGQHVAHTRFRAGVRGPDDPQLDRGGGCFALALQGYVPVDSA